MQKQSETKGLHSDKHGYLL